MTTTDVVLTVEANEHRSEVVQIADEYGVTFDARCSCGWMQQGWRRDIAEHFAFDHVKHGGQDDVRVEASGYIVEGETRWN